jgi:tight adherence protein B
MSWSLILLLFGGLFSTIALLLVVLMSGRDNASKQTIQRLERIKLGPQNPDTIEEPLSIRRTDVLSQFPLLDQLLQKLDVAPKLKLLLYQADVDWSVERLLLMCLGGGGLAAGLVYYRTEATLLAVVFFFLFGSLPVAFLLRKRTSRFFKMKERLPEALDLMVSAIRAGHSLTSAIGLASKESPEPIRREFRQCYDEQNFGLDMRVAMSNLAYRVPTSDIRMISAAVLIQKETGGNLTEILDKVSYLIREDFRLKKQADIHTAQGRLTGAFLSLLPFVLGIAIYIANPTAMSVLWTHPTGIMLMKVAVVMMAIGWFLIQRIIKVDI